MRLTRDDVSRVHSILVFDETKAIHELDFCNLSGTVGSKVVLDILLGD